jgi:hypothetical protein
MVYEIATEELAKRMNAYGRDFGGLVIRLVI